MRRVAIVLLALLFAIPLQAGLIIRGSGGAGCSTPDNGDYLDEGWEGTGAENTWTLFGSGTFDQDYALPGSPPTGSCSEGLKIDADSIQSSHYWDKGSVHDRSTDLDVVCHIYVSSNTTGTSAPDLTNIISWQLGTTPNSNVVANISLRWQTGTTWYLRPIDLSTPSVTIDLDTWYTVTMHMDGTAASSYMQVVGGGSTTCDVADECPFTRLDTVDGRYLHLGNNNATGGGINLDMSVGYCYVNSP